MKNVSSLAPQDEFSKFLWLSIGLHVLLFVLLAVRAVLFPTTIPSMEPAIRVDIVGLPDKYAVLPAPEETPKEAAKPEPKPGEKPPPVTEEKPKLPAKEAAKVKVDANKINLEKTKKAQELAMQKMRAMEKLREQMNEEKAKAAKAAPIRGAEKTAGNSLTGLAKLDFDSYFATLDHHVKEHWALPEWMRNAKLRMRVKIFFDRDGILLKKQVLMESSNPIFNERVLEAIERASPFPKPPDRLVNFFSLEGVEVNFVPE